MGWEHDGLEGKSRRRRTHCLFTPRTASAALPTPHTKHAPRTDAAARLARHGCQRPCDGVGLPAAAAGAMVPRMQHRPLSYACTHTLHTGICTHGQCTQHPRHAVHGGRAARRAPRGRPATASCMHAGSHAAATHGPTRTPHPCTPRTRTRQHALWVTHPPTHHTGGKRAPHAHGQPQGQGPGATRNERSKTDRVKAMAID